MPFVFKFSAGLLVLAALGGQIWQRLPADAGWNKTAAELRSECPSMGGPQLVRTKGDVVRLLDARLRRTISGSLGLGGCYAGA